MTRLSQLLTTLFFVSAISAISAQGVFTSAATGNWGISGSWTLSSGTDADGIPDADDNVTIGTHVITVTQAEACNDLTISSPSTNRLALGANTLTINNQLKYGVAPTSDSHITSTAGTGRIKFVGASRALFVTSAAFGNGYEVEVALNSGAIGTAASTLKFRALYVTSGTFNVTGEVRIDGGSDGNANGKVEVASGATLIVSGGIGARTSTTSTYCGSITVDGTLENSGSRLSGTTITINGTLRLKSSSALTSNPSSLTDPEFIYGSSAILEYNAASGNMSMGAEVDRAAGTANPTIPEMIINTAAANNVTTNFKLPLVNKVTFTSGKVTCGSLFTVVSGGTITGFNSSKYFITSSSTNALRRNAVGGTTTDFPVGTTSLYLPATINNSGTADNFTVFTTASTPTCLPAATSIPATWDITEAVAGSSNCAITLDYGTAVPGGSFDIGTARIAHCTGTTPDYANGSGSGTLVSGTGFTTFSPFGINSLPNLPIELAYFKAIALDLVNQISWETKIEKDVQYHLLEKSKDGISWSSLESFDGELLSTEAKQYEFIDAAPFTQTYYRLRTINTDGSEQLSNQVLVKRNDRNAGVISVTPTITTGVVQVQYAGAQDENYHLQVLNSIGAVVYARQFNPLQNGQAWTIDLTSQASGIYSIIMRGDNGLVEQVRIVKQ